jgi:hypothetical protein
MGKGRKDRRCWCFNLMAKYDIALQTIITDGLQNRFTVGNGKKSIPSKYPDSHP